MNLKPKPSADTEGSSMRISWKDSVSLSAVWEWTNDDREIIETRFNIPVMELPFVIRLFDVSERDIKEDGLDHYVDFHINYLASDWILYGVEEGRTYCVELGVRMIDGRYYPLKRSNKI